MRPGLIAALLAVLVPLVPTATARAATTLRIMPPDGATIAAGQRFDVRVEATGDATEPPRGLQVQLDARDLTPLNVLGPGPGGEKGAGGTGTPAGFSGRPASTAPARTTNLLVQDLVIDTPGRHVIRARTGDGATLESVVQVDAWMQPRAGARPASNIILFLGDGMGAGAPHRGAHRPRACTTARRRAAGDGHAARSPACR